MAVWTPILCRARMQTNSDAGRKGRVWGREKRLRGPLLDLFAAPPPSASLQRRAAAAAAAALRIVRERESERQASRGFVPRDKGRGLIPPETTGIEDVLGGVKYRPGITELVVLERRI